MVNLEGYVEIYKKHQDRKSFVAEAKKKFPKLKQSSLERRFAQVSKVCIESIVKINNKVHFEEAETIMPPATKLFMVEDMKRFKKDINKQVLLTYGFSQAEINWLLFHNKIKKEYVETDDSSDDEKIDDEVKR